MVYQVTEHKDVLLLDEFMKEKKIAHIKVSTELKLTIMDELEYRLEQFRDDCEGQPEMRQKLAVVSDNLAKAVNHLYDIDDSLCPEITLSVMNYLEGIMESGEYGF